ncbi:hypothetical protein FB451DRAFT_1465277, partial [Mycena latifolia]
PPHNLITLVLASPLFVFVRPPPFSQTQIASFASSLDRRPPSRPPRLQINSSYMAFPFPRSNFFPSQLLYSGSFKLFGIGYCSANPATRGQLRLVALHYQLRRLCELRPALGGPSAAECGRWRLFEELMTAHFSPTWFTFAGGKYGPNSMVQTGLEGCRSRDDTRSSSADLSVTISWPLNPVQNTQFTWVQGPDAAL